MARLVAVRRPRPPPDHQGRSDAVAAIPASTPDPAARSSRRRTASVDMATSPTGSTSPASGSRRSDGAHAWSDNDRRCSHRRLVDAPMLGAACQRRTPKSRPRSAGAPPTLCGRLRRRRARIDVDHLDVKVGIRGSAVNSDRHEGQDPAGRTDRVEAADPQPSKSSNPGDPSTWVKGGNGSVRSSTHSWTPSSARGSTARPDRGQSHRPRRCPDGLVEADDAR